MCDMEFGKGRPLIFPFLFDVRFLIVPCFIYPTFFLCSLFGSGMRISRLPCAESSLRCCLFSCRRGLGTGGPILRGSAVYICTNNVLKEKEGMVCQLTGMT
jgi:hypothetical protein